MKRTFKCWVPEQGRANAIEVEQFSAEYAAAFAAERMNDASGGELTEKLIRDDFQLMVEDVEQGLAPELFNCQAEAELYYDAEKA